MRVLVFSDIEGKIELPYIKPDLVLLLGDIDRINIEKIDNTYDCPKFGVLGNADSSDVFDNTGIVNVHESIVECKGLKIAGFGGIPSYKPNVLTHFDELEIGSFLDLIDKVDIFIAHSNPMWEENNDMTDAYRGFASFVEYIEEMQPSYFLHGHLHEESVKQVGNTKVFCVYPYLELRINSSEDY